MFRISLGITLAISEASQFNSIRAVLIVPANISLGMDFDKEGISCLLIGAAKHGQYCVGGEEQQYQMIESVKDDLRKIIEFASKQTSQVLSSRPKTRCHMKICRILMSEDLMTGDPNAMGEISEAHDDPRYRYLIQAAKVVPYKSKADVRKEVKDFLRDSETKHLFLFMAGHGSQDKPRQEPVRESFLLPAPQGKPDQYYFDFELSEDIQEMKEDKRLYIVIHSCHSGGMVNLWQLKKNRDIALFASAEADILAEWSNDGDYDSAGDFGADEKPMMGYIESFCLNANVGEPLKDIAEGILDDCATVDKERRPAFITSRPSFADATFGKSSSSS